MYTSVAAREAWRKLDEQVLRYEQPKCVVRVDVVDSGNNQSHSRRIDKNTPIAIATPAKISKLGLVRSLC